VILRSLDLAALWLRERPTRVHAHFVDQTAVAAVLACRLWCVPVSCTAHARDIFDSPPRRLPTLARYGARFVAVCRYNRDALIARGVPADAIAVIPCGTDTTGDDFPARSAGEYDGTLRVLVVARLVAKKGIDDLLQAVTDEAVAALMDEVRVIGDGPDRERLDLLAEEARRAGVRVSFLGPAPRGQHAAPLRWANLSCLPCKVAPDGDRDSMPLAIKEALVARVPVLTTTAVGIPEMVDDRTAIIVGPDDPAAIARGLRKYAGLSGAQRAALAEAGRRRVALRFDLVDTVGAVKDFLLENARPQRWESDA
jgi:colanic acid/amylovoran biosynthesis glycosyltransferase